MKSMSVSWTDAVDDLEAHFALDAVQRIAGRLQEEGFYRGWLQAAPVVNTFGDWHIPDLPEDAAYRSYRWYIEQSLDATGRSVIGDKLLQVILNEPWQRLNPHYDLSLIGERLAAEGGGEASWAALIPGRVAVVSVAPMRRITDERVRLFAVRRTVAHALGRLFGVPRPGQPHAVASPGGEPHCANICAMRAAANLEELVQLTLEELQKEVVLCDDCWRDLQCLMLDSHFGAN